MLNYGLLWHIVTATAACGQIINILCGLRAFFSKCGHRIDLSLRPMRPSNAWFSVEKVMKFYCEVFAIFDTYFYFK